jgi:glycosyltransferase involved in cell wall biosynthesis
LPKISICIPAYKRTAFLNRLLNSITEQTFKDFEVIVSDDSPDESVKELCSQFASLSIQYYKNPQPLGTPANWNAAIKKSSGQWIKLMHDDDWFAGSDSLEAFARETDKEEKFIFSAYVNVFEENNRQQHVSMPANWEKNIRINPSLLLSRNVIGPPSVTLIHRSINDVYDERMKWRVDIDFYIGILKRNMGFIYVDKQLVNVGISESQVTNYCIGMPEVELPEGLLLLKKNGIAPLKNIFIYDAWWRILRNTGVRNDEQLHKYTNKQEWPKALKAMVRHQAMVPQKFLKAGPISKLTMFLSYVFNFKRLKG